MSEPGGQGEEELLPEQSVDDTDDGWGERADDADDERLTREKPPHY